MATSERKARLFRQREQELLDAAAALIREQDWRAVTVERIAARAGIAKGTVYLHVRTKAEVAAKLALRHLKRVAGAWSRVSAALPARDRAAALLAAAQEVSLAHSGAFELVQAALHVQDALPEALHAELEAAWRPLEAALADALAGMLPGVAAADGVTRAALAWALFQAVSAPVPLSADTPAFASPGALLHSLHA